MDVAGIVEAGVFFLFATITIGGALGLILAQRVAHSMLSLIFCFMAVSGIFILLGAEFLAAIQILVYLASVGLVVCLVLCLLEGKFGGGFRMKFVSWSQELASWHWL